MYRKAIDKAAPIFYYILDKYEFRQKTKIFPFFSMQVVLSFLQHAFFVNQVMKYDLVKFYDFAKAKDKPF